MSSDLPAPKAPESIVSNKKFSPPASVSVVIRTIGRPELRQAVESVQMQTHVQKRRPLDIVIVNAADTTLPHFDLPGIPVHEVRRGRKLTRPEAANAGLDAATSDYVCFLDDDDWFHPGHIESLLKLLTANPAIKLAYSGVLLVHGDGTPYARLNRPFDREALFRGNYIQMGAALFSRKLLDDGARFDETLLNFQDWDFWLQLAQRTDFLHSDEVTLSWRAFDGQSGSGMGRNADLTLQASYTRRVQQKWARAAAALSGARSPALVGGG
jgi:glycosyltransferase involved in cell wall biosynthesis